MSESQKPFLLYADFTPNGLPITSFLEELKAIYPVIAYDVEMIDIMGTRHKEPWYLKLNPNGRIAVLVDRSRNDFIVFETSAILLYLVQHYDKDFKFGFNPSMMRMSTVFYFNDSFFPHHFLHYAPEDVPYGKKRYGNEVMRLYGVFELRLKDREYLAGPGKGHYPIVDVKAWPWYVYSEAAYARNSAHVLGCVKKHAHAGIPTLDEWPHVKAWLQRCVEREGSKRGQEQLQRN